MNLTFILALLLFVVLLFAKGFAFILLAAGASYFAIKGLSNGNGFSFVSQEKQNQVANAAMFL